MSRQFVINVMIFGYNSAFLFGSEEHNPQAQIPPGNPKTCIEARRERTNPNDKTPPFLWMLPNSRTSRAPRQVIPLLSHGEIK